MIESGLDELEEVMAMVVPLIREGEITCSVRHDAYPS